MSTVADTSREVCASKRDRLAQTPSHHSPVSYSILSHMSAPGLAFAGYMAGYTEAEVSFYLIATITSVIDFV